MNTFVRAGKVIQYIIEKDIERRPIGSIYFKDINVQYKSAEFGIFIGEDEARNKGNGTVAAKAFVEFGFKELHLHRIMLRLLENNHAAYRSYLTVGFEQEGLFRDMVFLDGDYENIIFMSIINPAEQANI